MNDNKTIKIGGHKYKLEDLSPDLRKKIEEQVPELKLELKLKEKEKSEKEISTSEVENEKHKKTEKTEKSKSQEKKQIKEMSLFRKIFGYGKRK